MSATCGSGDPDGNLKYRSSALPAVHDRREKRFFHITVDGRPVRLPALYSNSSGKLERQYSRMWILLAAGVQGNLSDHPLYYRPPGLNALEDLTLTKAAEIYIHDGAEFFTVIPEDFHVPVLTDKKP